MNVCCEFMSGFYCTNPWHTFMCSSIFMGCIFNCYHDFSTTRTGQRQCPARSSETVFLILVKGIKFLQRLVFHKGCS